MWRVGAGEQLLGMPARQAGVCGLSMWAFGATIEKLQNPSLGRRYTAIPAIPSPPPSTLGYLGWGAQKQILRQGSKYKWFICEAIQELLEGRRVSKGDREGEGASAGAPSSLFEGGWQELRPAGEL